MNDSHNVPKVYCTDFRCRPDEGPAAKLKREDRSIDVRILTKGKDISYAGCGLPYSHSLCTSVEKSWQEYHNDHGR